jgi:hypothetical protein
MKSLKTEISTIYEKSKNRDFGNFDEEPKNREFQFFRETNENIYIIYIWSFGYRLSQERRKGGLKLCPPYLSSSSLDKVKFKKKER